MVEGTVTSLRNECARWLSKEANGWKVPEVEDQFVFRGAVVKFVGVEPYALSKRSEVVVGYGCGGYGSNSNLEKSARLGQLALVTGSPGMM